MYEDLAINSLFETKNYIGSTLFENYTYPWDVLSEIEEYILCLGKSLSTLKFYLLDRNVWVANGVIIPISAQIQGPTIVCKGTIIRPGAFIRGNVLIGKDCVIGNSTELKNSVIMNNVQIPHFNYVGDSIIGNYSHFGAGAITSNVKSDKSLVTIRGGYNIQTGLKKVGAFVGDHVEIGCNSVLCPGTIIGKNSQIYPITLVRGVIPCQSILKNNGQIKRRFV